MATQPFDDSEYPYSTKPPVILGPAKYLQSSDRNYLESPGPSFSWGALFGVLWRLSLVAGALFVLLMLPIVVVVYRARSQAAVIAELEARGCDIDYEVSFVGEPDNLQEFLQKQFGNEYFGDVDAVWARRLTTPEQAAAICRRCVRFSKLKSFEIHSDAFEFKQIANWPQLDQLTSLEIHSNQLTDDDLARIAQMKQLNDLELSSSRITEAGIHGLSAIPQLASLKLCCVPLPSKDSRNDLGFPHLTLLSFENCEGFRDQMIVNLGPLPELTQILFDESAVGDEAVQHLVGGGKLEWVNLRGTKITDQGLSHLARCAKLSTLDVSNTEVTDEGIQKLKSCGELSFLIASETKITGKGWNVLHGERLHLVVDHTEFNDEGLKDVLAISGLLDVDATDAKVSGAVAGPLSELENVHLELRGNPLTPAGIQVLAKAKCDLSLTNTPIDDKGLMSFLNNDNIGSLDVSATKVTSAGVVAFYEARKARLEKVGQKETLALYCDFPDAIEPYLPQGDFPGGAPPDSPPIEFEQPPEGDQPSPAQP